MDSTIYNQNGEEVGKIKLPESVFGIKWNADLVHQVVVSQSANERTPVAHAKNRAEVRGGGKKPWKQKGTGRARHGSIRSPLWRHGGKAHGPNKETIFAKKINQKMRTKALFSVLSAKERDGEIIFLDNITLKNVKTKEASSILTTLASKLNKKEIAYKKGNRVIVATAGRNSALERSYANIHSVCVDDVRNLNPKQALDYKYVIFVGGEECLGILNKRVESHKLSK
ncbi:MAG TPA: 50S ribosomal protein L4 [Candidatus Paceibacterota bacterium]